MILAQGPMARAEMLGQWDVQGLPSNVGGLTSVELPTDPHDAANVLRHKLENHGYPLAEVRIDGNRLTVIHGEITEIEIRGLDGEVAGLVYSYVDDLKGLSPTTDQLSHTIALINDVPGLQASANLVRLDDLGHYKILVTGEQHWQAGVLSVRNTPTLDFASREISIHQEFYSGLLAGDIIRLDATLVNTDIDSEAHSFEIGYQLPVNDKGTYVEARLSRFDAQSDNVFEPELGVDTTVTSGALVIGHAFKRFIEVADFVYTELDFRNQDDAGAGSTDHGILRAAFFETYHGEHGDTFSWNVSVTAGRELSGGDETFGALRGGLGWIFWVPQLFETAEMRIELSAQLGTSNVPGFELFSFGGASRQRGFAPFEYAGNHGIDVTVEAAETFQPWAGSGPVITPYAFVDATYLANVSSAVSNERPRRNELVSAGIGSKVSFANGLSFDSWIASPLHDGAEAGRSRGLEFFIQGQFTW